MARFFRDNGLSLVLFAIFLALLGGQSVVGMYQYNEEQEAHSEPTVSYAAYLATPHFGEAVFENWESEFLQMGAYIVLTMFLFQRGSAESSDPDAASDEAAELAARRDDPEAPGPVRRGAATLALYRHSLWIAFLLLFIGSFLGHGVTGLGEYNAEQLAHGDPTVTLGEFMTGSQFWFESLQNWQSEFLAVFLIVVLSIWLRADGSPESKKVWEPHRKTGTE